MTSGGKEQMHSTTSLLSIAQEELERMCLEDPEELIHCQIELLTRLTNTWGARAQARNTANTAINTADIIGHQSLHQVGMQGCTVDAKSLSSDTCAIGSACYADMPASCSQAYHGPGGRTAATVPFCRESEGS